jgi:5,10-methylenetetrahydrofolate reductase
VDYVAEIAEYVKENKKSAFVLTQFTIVSNGYTRKGIRIPRIIKEVKATGVVDAYGFNCGVGPTLLYNSLKDIDFSGDIVSVLPNAGYPQLVNERTVYAANSEYFSDRMVDLADLGAKIIGGCCGTTPIHIKKTAEKIRSGKQKVTSGPVRVRQELASDKQRPSFGQSRKHMVAVELDPPFDVDLEPIMRGAGLLRDSGVVDFITVADSPLARVRVDSIMVGAKIKREFGIETIPHICCRDRNVLALKSGLLGAHMEGIRNLLIVTGDPVSAAERIDVKSVFNLNSVKLMKLISEMNRDVFAEDPFRIGGALNLNVRNKDAEVARMYKKIENGATFFLTQPIFADETIEYLSRLNKEGAKIFAGIMPIVSYRNAQFLNNEIPGIHIPQSYIDRFSEGMSREDAEETGIEISTTIASKIKDFVDGFYFITPFNRVSMIIKILQRVLQ